MISKVFQYDEYGNVHSYSDKELKCNRLKQQKLSITKDQEDKIKSNLYNISVKDGGIIFKEKNPKDEKMEELINQAKKDYPKLTPLLEKMLKKINNQEISQNI